MKLRGIKMKKERFNELKLKFTDGNGKYIFPVAICKMQKEDLKDYIDYLQEKFNKATYFANSIGSFKAIERETKCLHDLINVLNLIKINRPDFKLNEKQNKLALFKGGVQFV